MKKLLLAMAILAIAGITGTSNAEIYGKWFGVNVDGVHCSIAFEGDAEGNTPNLAYFYCDGDTMISPQAYSLSRGYVNISILGKFVLADNDNDLIYLPAGTIVFQAWSFPPLDP